MYFDFNNLPLYLNKHLVNYCLVQITWALTNLPHIFLIRFMNIKLKLLQNHFDTDSLVYVANMPILDQSKAANACARTVLPK